MGSRMIDLKRSQKKGDSKAKGIAIHLGPESDYPPEAGFSVSGDHSKKLFSDGLPAPKSRVSVTMESSTPSLKKSTTTRSPPDA